MLPPWEDKKAGGWKIMCSLFRRTCCHITALQSPPPRSEQTWTGIRNFQLHAWSSLFWWPSHPSCYAGCYLGRGIQKLFSFFLEIILYFHGALFLLYFFSCRWCFPFVSTVGSFFISMNSIQCWIQVENACLHCSCVGGRNEGTKKKYDEKRASNGFLAGCTNYYWFYGWQI